MLLGENGTTESPAHWHLKSKVTEDREEVDSISQVVPVPEKPEPFGTNSLDTKVLVITLDTNGGGGGTHPLKNLIIPFKYGRELGESLKVSEKLKVIECLLSDQHGNNSRINSFRSIFPET